MGIALPGAGGATRQSMSSGAQVIDGSLKFDNSKNQHLKRTISASNRRTFTLSAWVKHFTTDSNDKLLGNYTDENNYSSFYFRDTPDFQISFVERVSSTYNINAHSRRMARDTGWYHIVWAIDTTQATDTNRVKLYVNGVQETLNASYSSGTITTTAPTLPSQNYETRILAAYDLNVGSRSGTDCWDGLMSQFYVIDGLALGPENFGYTDPLTNTWRPKKFGGNFTQSTSQYTGGTALTWDSDPIGSKWTLSNSNKTATGSGSASYTGGNVWSNTINSNTTYAWTLDITNGDTTGGWYFASSQSATATHPDELSGNTLGLRGGDSGAGTYGTFASANGTSDGQDKITGLSSVSPNGTKKIDFVVYRPASGTGKVWVKANLDSTWIGGGNPSDTSSTASFILPDGTTYFAFIGYDTSSTTTLTFAGDGTITSSQGTNSVYLPMDGNSPIGEDKSGKGNNYTPVNFGGSVALDNPQVSGARPILNTDGGGNVARPGVFGSEENLFYTVTTANGSVYQFDITSGDNPSLSFIRGATYKFDYSSFTGHPLLFSSTNPDSSVSAYTDGTSIASNVISFTVPHNTPDTLYYYCSNHPTAMNGAISITTDETKADLYASNCILALPLVGNKEDVVASINSAQTNVTVTNNGSVPFPTTESNFYSGSAFFEDMSSDNLTYTNFGSRFEFSGDYTLEAWVYPTSASATDGSIFVEQSGSNYFAFNFDPGTQFNIYNNSSSPSWSPSTNLPPANKWSHIALVRSGSTQTIYVNGNSIATNTASGTHGYASPSVARIGGGAGGAMDSYIQDFRVYNGVAKYTSDFVVPSTNPDILPDTPSGVSGGSKLAKVIDGAVAFDGSGDKLTSNSTDFVFGTSSFTVEAFVYKNSTSTKIFFSQTDNSAGGRNGIAIGYQSGALWILQGNGSIWSLEATVGSFPTNKWVHIAVSRDYSATKTYYFIDGQLVYTYETNINLSADNNGDIKIGSVENSGTTYDWDGFISNFRMVKGSAVYTSNFTPPTRELTNVTNTKLLCCQSTDSAGAAAVSPNISGINDGVVWSEESTITAPSSGFNPGGEIQYAFDGSTTTLSSGAGSRDEFFVIDFPNDITVSTSLEIYMSSGASQFKINDGSFSSSLNNGAWRDLSFTGTLSKLTVKGDEPQTYGNFAPRLSAIRIDGSTILTDPVTKNGNAAATNFNPFNTNINTVRGQETGYATWNPLSLKLNQGTLSDGNLTLSATGSYYIEAKSTFDASMVDNYSELSISSASGSDSFAFGIAASGDAWIISGVGTYLVYRENGAIIRYPGNTTVATVSSYTVGDVLGMAIDSTNVKFYKNNILQGTYAHGYSKDYFVTALNVPNSGTSTMTANFGQKPFKFPPPTGFQPLNAANVRPETVITRPDHYVGVKLYTGITQSPRTISLPITPDLIWVKNRDTAKGHFLLDTVRGDNNNLRTDGTYNQSAVNGSSHGILSTIGNNSFSVKDGSSTGDNVGSTGTDDYVAWFWKAGGNKNTFNVDDVGYASASDVNMNVGGLNSSLYNTSQVWSSTYAGSAIDGSYPITQAFDGNRSTTARVSAIQTVMSVALTNITVVDKIEICGEIGYNTPNVSVTVGGVTHNIGGDPNTAVSGTSGTTSKTITGVSGALTNVTVGKVSSGRTYLSQIIVDGKILVNSNITPPNVPSIANTGASVGTKHGFSIIKWTAPNPQDNSATIPHGLTQKPDFWVVKSIDGDRDWIAYTQQIDGSLDFMHFNNTDAAGNSSATAPTDTTFSVYGDDINTAGEDQIAYLWHSVPGLQKFGKYEGNTTEGAFVELGFRPAIVWIKAADQTWYWNVQDTARSPINPSQGNILRFDTTAEENADSGNNNIDFLSNGFKIRSTTAQSEPTNVNAQTYIYCAWAEAPTFNLYGAQSNAR